MKVVNPTIYSAKVIRERRFKQKTGSAYWIRRVLGSRDASDDWRLAMIESTSISCGGLRRRTMQGTLLYLAPECTGNLGRIIDTDLQVADDFRLRVA